MSLLECLCEDVQKPEIVESDEYKAIKSRKVKVPTKKRTPKINADEKAEDVVDSAMKNIADNLARKKQTYFLVNDMNNRNSTAEQNLNDCDANELSLSKRFKKLLDVDEGLNLRVLEHQIEAENPTMSISAIKAKALTDLRKRDKQDGRLQWASNLPDSAIMQILRSDQSEAAQKLVEEFEDKHAILNSRTEDELKLQSCMNELRRLDKKRSKSTADRAMKKAKKLLSQTASAVATVEDADAADGEEVEAEPKKDAVAPVDFEVTNRLKLYDAPIRVQEKTVGESGLVVHKNNMGEIIEPDVYSMSKFAAMFAAGMTKSEDAMANDVASFMDRVHTQVVNEWMKMLDSAPADACLTVKGERPSGSIAVDLRRLLEENGFDASSLSNERLLKYHSVWQQTHTATPADTENALAIRVNRINRENACRLMRSIGMTEQTIELAMAHGKNVEYSEFMKCVYKSINTIAFIRAEEQAEADTQLAERVKVDLKKATKEQAASSKTGGRGREALGMKSNNTPQATAKLLGVAQEEIDLDYITTFMRPAIYDGERNCAREESCFCVIFASTFPMISSPEGKGCAFICRELLLPSQVSTYETHRKLPEYRHLCYVCELTAVSTAVYHNVENRKEPTMPLHRFTVKVDQKGGFRKELLLEPIACGTRHTGIIGPFPALNTQNLAYAKTVIDGRVYNCMVHTGTDFRTGSTSTQRI